MKTFMPKEADISRNWFIVDAAGKPAGRLAVEISTVLRGKHKPTYTPHVDAGDFVVVVNAGKVALTGKKEDDKIYQHFTGYPSGRKEYKASFVRRKHPDRIIRQAVRGMMPKNRSARHMMTRLKVYPGAEHPHQAQKPQELMAG